MTDVYFAAIVMDGCNQAILIAANVEHGEVIHNFSGRKSFSQSAKLPKSVVCMIVCQRRSGCSLSEWLSQNVRSALREMTRISLSIIGLRGGDMQRMQSDSK